MGKLTPTTSTAATMAIIPTPMATMAASAPTTLPTLTLHPMPTTLTLEALSTPSENDLPNPSLRPKPILITTTDTADGEGITDTDAHTGADTMAGGNRPHGHKDLENLSVSSIINCHHPLC